MPYAVIAQRDDFVNANLLYWLKDRAKLVAAYDDLMAEWKLIFTSESPRANTLNCALAALYEVRQESEKMAKEWGGLLFCFDGCSLLRPLQGGAA